MSIRRLTTTMALAAGLLTALPAAAQFARPEQAVNYRKAGMTLMAAHFGRIGAAANGRVPYDAAAVQANADLVVTLSKLPFAGFVEGTSGTEKFTAKSVIWTQRAKFDEGARKMQDAVVKLQTAAKSNNLDQIKAAFGDAAKTCDACHDDFRN